MEAVTGPSYAGYAPLSHLSQSTSTANHIHASMHESSWHHTHISAQSASLTPAQSPSMFSVAERPSDLGYPSPAPSSASPPYTQTDQYVVNHNSPALHLNSSNDAMFSQFNQVESRIGPSRVLTRRQRAALEQGGLGRRASMPSNFQRPQPAPSPRLSSGLYPTPPIATSRLQTPNNEESSPFQRDRLSLNIASAVPLQLQSPSYHPMTPTSMTSPSYSYHMYGHSRSTSGSTSNHQRVPSPALSTVSALTSVSSSASGPGTHAFSPYPRPTSHVLPTIDGAKPKQKKQRLDNTARKNICLYQSQNPSARQEDIASVFKVERSTISKILKHKNKWLNMPDNLGARIAKHRPSKFPEIEEELIQWLEECSRKKITISDNSIRTKAKETARMLHISEEKFKASSGWVENFKSRHGIRAGIWAGASKASSSARVLIDSTGDSILSPLNPAFGGRSEGGEMNASSPHDDEDLESEGSPEPEDSRHRGADEQMAEPSAMTLQSPWAASTNIASSSQHINNSASSQPSLAQPPIEPHPDHSGRRLAPLTSSSHQHAPEPDHHLPQYIDNSSAYYPEPPIPEPRLPTLAEAEDAMNTLITFLDSSGQGILEDSERQMLTTVKCALFQAASGVPFDRSRQ
ncbi:hypothetical protein Hypma_000880 [Hypsizygus marmoreus]|uniref:HTH CENPB-type domain-containing protein n=1 Tax=Hypsizygus marmoreus TaxID=39966 RepID=A0A369JBW0_HYPMA|nr:hypothetical protein Hypma_000880 [Hypsizygus marmoreus]